MASDFIALPLSAWLCQVLGSANAFLEFVRRKALVIEFSPKVFIFGAAAAVFSICVMVFPVMRYANVSIVAHKQRKNRKSEKPFWQKIYLDFVLLGVSLYGLYSFNNQKNLLAQRVLDGASLDPLLFLCSSLFIIGAGLVALRIIPIIIWLIFTAFKRLWSPGLYASFLRVLRTRSSQGFIMVFLMLTVALGIFNAQTARTVNTNAEEQVEYMAGADLVMQEKWQDNSQSMSDSSASSDVNYIEPDFGKYMNIDGVESVTRVYQSYDGTATTGGKTIKIMSSAQDHKRAKDGDQGLNTGGMGNFSPSPFYTKEVDEFCRKHIYQATVDAMAAEGRPFTGVIFFGLMLTEDGPKVLEYNARFGDPEAQVVLPRMKNDIIDVMEACVDGKLDTIDLQFEDNAAVCVVLASDGYPVSYEKGFPITGLEKFDGKDDYFCFHAGTKFDENGTIVTNGGRVLGITATGKDLKEARAKAYEATEWVDFANKYMRHDIGRAIDEVK